MTNRPELKNLRCLSIVMPVYNEVQTIRQIVRLVLSVPCPKELIIVDDASTDGTRQTLEAMKAEASTLLNKSPDSSLKFVFQNKNQGKGAALRAGFQQCTGDITIIQDADLEYNPNEYFRVIEPILSGEADVVYGSRFLGERRRVLLFWHQWGNKILTLLSNMLTNLNLTDMETCYKAFKTDIIRSIPIRSNRFGFEPEITAKVAKLRCSIFEVPISYKGRGYDEGKKINWKDGISALYTILKFWVWDDLFKEDSGHHTLRIMEGASEYNSWLYSRAKPFLGRRVLEVGSGVGNITKHLLDRETVIATDISPVYLGDLKRTFGQYDHIHIRNFDLTEQNAATELQKQFSPDSILSMNVIEHIEDDTRAAHNLNFALKVGGRVVLLLPAHMALYSQLDEHLGHYRRYTKKSLSALLEGAHFEVERISYLNTLGALGWFVNGRLLRRKILPSRQLRAFDLIAPLLKLEEKIDPPFGLSVLAVARKTKDII